MRKKGGKTAIVFDEKKRRDYLLGFQKRKKERRNKAKHDLDERLKEERKNMREMKRKDRGDNGMHVNLPWNSATSSSDANAPAKLEDSTLDLPQHSVHVWQLPQFDTTHTDVFLGRNVIAEEKPAPEEADDPRAGSSSNWDGDGGTSKFSAKPSLSKGRIAKADPKKLKSLERMARRLSKSKTRSNPSRPRPPSSQHPVSKVAGKGKSRKEGGRRKK